MATYDREKMMAVINYLNGEEEFVAAKGAIVVKQEEVDDDHIASLLRDALTFYDESYAKTQCPHCLEEMPSPEEEDGKIVCIFCGNDMNKKPEPVKEPTVEDVQKEQLEVMGDLDDEPKPEEPKQKRKRRTREQMDEDKRKLAAELAKERQEKQKDIPELTAEKPVAKEVKSSAPIGVPEDVAKQVLANDTKVVVQEKVVKEDKEEVETEKSLWLSDVLTDDMSITLTVAQLKSLLNVEK